ncbi:MAG TPA: SOS response-associated peptidase [Micromonosporaceae bacterium]
MCGRYASLRGARDLATMFDASDAMVEESLAASYNVAPTDPVYVIRSGSGAAGQRVVSVARWGLLPPWVTDVRAGARMINARAETVRTSRAYRGPFESRRCLVPADGWYEWLRQPNSGAKQAYYLTPCDGDVLAFAGLWQLWGPDRLLTTTVLTTRAVGDLATIHERMPLVLPADRWAMWLRGGPLEAAGLLEPSGEGWVSRIELRRVGPAVGNVRNNSPALIESVTDRKPSVNAVDPVDLTLF